MNSTDQPGLLQLAEKIDTRTTAGVTILLWSAALIFYLFRVLPQLPDAPGGAFDFAETLLLAIACLGFQLSALRVGMDHIAHIWHGTIDPGRQTASPARWRVFGRLGAASWVASLGVGVPAAVGAWHPDSTELVFALVIVLIPAVQCTGAAVIGPILTRTIQTREAAYEGRRVVSQASRTDRERSQKEA